MTVIVLSNSTFRNDQDLYLTFNHADKQGKHQQMPEDFVMTDVGRFGRHVVLLMYCTLDFNWQLLIISDQEWEDQTSALLIQALLNVYYFNEHWQRLVNQLLSRWFFKGSFYLANHYVGRCGFLSHVRARLLIYFHTSLCFFTFSIISSLALTSKSLYNRVPDLERCQ